METSQNLAIESFSFHWLTNKNHCFDSLCEQPLRKSFDFFDVKSSKETTKPSQTSIFYFPTSKPNTTIVHADEIFSHGLILPKYTERENKKVLVSSYSVPSSPTSSFLQRTHSPNDRVSIRFFRNWGKTSKKILRKYFSFFKPPCREVECARKSVKVDDFNGKYWTAKSLNNSPQFSPRTLNRAENCSEMKKVIRKIKSMSSSPHGSPPRLQSSYRNDLLGVDEAILHCKKSIGR